MDSEQIDELRNPDIFPEKSGEVEIIQTHLSVVCLVGERVYKVKKSLKLPFADFSSLEKRRKFCEDELRLNRRLCPETYLEVVPLVKGEDGSLRMVLEGGDDCGGETIDHAVRMKRLPADRMLDVLLEEDAVSVGEIREIASRMVAFHREARRDARVGELGGPEKLREFALENFEETRGNIGGIFSKVLHEALQRGTVRDFERFDELLRHRAREKLVVDGHGDLHARNICLTDPVSIYDCIEFNAGLRCGDVANEHAFLVMDLRFRGHPELARTYLEAVVEETGDRDLWRLIPMLVCYRAMVRAKVVAIAANEEEIPENERREAVTTARRYFRLAASSVVNASRPLWVALCGLPATGKSTLARALVEASGGTWDLQASDLVRKELAGVSPREHLPDSFYTPEFSRRTYTELYSRAEATTKSATGTAPVVILDANFRSAAERSRAREAAERAGADLALVELTASNEVIRSRLQERARSSEVTSDANLEVFEKLQKTFEQPGPGEGHPLICVASRGNPEEIVDEVLADLV